MLTHTGEGSLLNPLIQMLISSGNALTNTSRNHVLIWAPDGQSQVDTKLTIRKEVQMWGGSKMNQVKERQLKRDEVQQVCCDGNWAQLWRELVQIGGGGGLRTFNNGDTRYVTELQCWMLYNCLLIIPGLFHIVYQDKKERKNGRERKRGRLPRILSVIS